MISANFVAAEWWEQVKYLTTKARRGPVNKKYTGKFKANIALEAIKGEKTIPQIASEYGIYP